MLKAIFIDMDNTLLETEELYDQAKFLLFDYLRFFGVTREEAAAAFDGIDRELYKTYGYSRLRQPQIFEDTLRHFIPEADADMVKTVRDWAETIFEREARLKKDVVKAIGILSASWPVYIVTAGDESVQNARVEKLPFLEQIAGIYVVEKKDRTVYETVLQELGFAPSSVVMIGDSLKSDILPAVEAGLHAVWIEAHNFQMEKVALDSLPERAHKFDTLLELAKHLADEGMPAPKAKAAAPNPPRPGI